MVQNIITDLCHHLEVGIDGNLDIGNKRVIVGTPTITLTNNILTISCDTVGANIYYTLDGSTPTSNSTNYTSAVTLNSSCTIKAIAIKGNKSSIVVSQDYIAILTAWKIVGNSEVHTLPYPDGIVLPTGYKRCKYLEFHNAEYFDTGIIPEQGMELYAKINSPLPSADCGVIGGRSSAWSADSLYIYRSKGNNCLYTSYGGDIVYSAQDNIRLNDSDIVEVFINAIKHTVKTESQTYEKACNKAITKGSNSIYIGAVSNFATKFTGKIYAVEISMNNVVLFNGIPCLDDNDVPCLYDTISDTSFYNDGTGTFGYEIEPQPTEIWSCGEYNPIDGKWHILVQPQGGSIADIALTEPLRMVGDVVDTIEFPSVSEGKALVTRNLYSAVINTCEVSTISGGKICAIKLLGFPARIRYVDTGTAPLLCNKMETLPYATCLSYEGIACCLYGTSIYIRNSNIEQTQQAYQYYFDNELGSVNFIYQLATPTTELVDAPQIQEADSYSMVISQGAKAVEWSSFIHNPS